MTGVTPPSALQHALVHAWTRRGPLAWLLWPVSLLFGALAALRRGLYRAGLLKTQRVPALVVVVGNVVAGGSGKTPVVMALVRHLQNRDLHVGVISRGYGRRAGDCREVLDDSAVSDVGDEPALIKRATSVPVFVAAHRADAARALLTHYPTTQVILCDDGLQHLGLHRDLEICVFDDRGIGNGFLLPAGPLREPWPRAVDLVLHTGAQPAFAGWRAQRTLARHVHRADNSRITLTELTETNVKPLLAVAAIAKPEDFFAMLRAHGLPLARTLALPDHHDFENWLPGAYAAYTILCTEKDAVKLWRKEPAALAVPLLVSPEPAFLRELDARLSASLAARRGSTLSSPHGHTTS
jgi:tetraacyldisaccharide 4'-kinase